MSRFEVSLVHGQGLQALAPGVSSELGATLSSALHSTQGSFEESKDPSD